MIQNHHKHLKSSMKDVLFELASTYKLMNPIRGVLPRSPFRRNPETIENADDVDMMVTEDLSEWMKEAAAYVKECITPDSQYKLKKFIDDGKLNRIWLDNTLFHLPKLHGSYVDARTGRRTIRGAKAKERIVASKDKAHGNEALTGGKVAKVRKCPPRCIVCCAINDPKNKDSKITQTTIHCSICLVSLCTKRIGNRKTNCFERFHQI